MNAQRLNMRVEEMAQEQDDLGFFSKNKKKLSKRSLPSRLAT